MHLFSVLCHGCGVEPRNPPRWFRAAWWACQLSLRVDSLAMRQVVWGYILPIAGPKQNLWPDLTLRQDQERDNKIENRGDRYNRKSEVHERTVGRTCSRNEEHQVGENNIRVDTQRWKTTKRKTQKEMERWHRGSRWQSMDENGPGSKCMAQVVEAICQQWHERLRWWWWWCICLTVSNSYIVKDHLFPVWGETSWFSQMRGLLSCMYRDLIIHSSFPSDSWSRVLNPPVESSWYQEGLTEPNLCHCWWGVPSCSVGSVQVIGLRPHTS